MTPRLTKLPLALVTPENVQQFIEQDFSKYNKFKAQRQRYEESEAIIELEESQRSKAHGQGFQIIDPL